MRVNLNDPRLSPTERMVLQRVHDKLSSSRQPLPPGYAEEIERVYGDCGGDPVHRGPTKRGECGDNGNEDLLPS